jgi:ABC-type branched-subunit amino acid transport system permease subunit
MNSKSMVTILAVTYGSIGILPLFLGDSSIIMRILTMILIWSIVASCWDLIMGYAGIFSFGQVAFYVIGAYSSAILSVSLNVPPIVSIFAAGIITAVIGVIIGVLVIVWMSLSGQWTGRLEPLRCPLHSFMTVVIGTLTILLVGLLASRIPSRKAPTA